MLNHVTGTNTAACLEAISVYETLARLLDYPSDNYLHMAKELRDKLGISHPQAGTSLSEFIVAIESLSLDSLEEMFTRTFDIAPICVPYLSSYAFGEESFERGDLMSKLKEVYANTGFHCGNELPDHIRILLSFLSTLNTQEGQDLVHYVMEKPLGEMLDRLTAAKNPYSILMKTIITILEADFSQEDRNA